MLSDSDQRGFLLPFLAGALITSPLWFRPCCGFGYPYPRPFGDVSFYNFNSANSFAATYPPYPFYGGYPGGGVGYGVPPYGGAFRKSKDKENDNNRNNTNNALRLIGGASGIGRLGYGGIGRLGYGGIGRFGLFNPFPFFRPRVTFPFNPEYCINSPFCYYHGHPFYQIYY